LQLNYDVTYTNNPNYSGPGTIQSETLEFNIDKHNNVEASHAFDFVSNRITGSAATFSSLINSAISSTGPTVSGYYSSNFSNINTVFPRINLIKSTASYPNIKTKAMAKFEYSNNPTYFVSYNGIVFKVLNYDIEKKSPPDIIKEYKIVNRPTKKSIMTYEYQSEIGVLSVNVRASIGKQNNQFYPNTTGTFSPLNDDSNSNSLPLYQYLNALYQYAGQLFMAQFGNPTVAFNWFISDSNYSFSSEGELNVKIDYNYTLKKRSNVLQSNQRPTTVPVGGY
jgi:hypothetical protein